MRRESVRRRIRSVRADNERGMLTMVMLVTIVGMSLGALLVPIVVRQSQSTTHSDSRVQALHAAQAGIDTMLGRIRNARPTDPNAVTGLFISAANLPCAAITGTVPGSTTASYSVTIAYDNSTAGTCPSASPLKATIRATGTDSSGSNAASRTLTAVYNFNTTSYSISSTTGGGQVRLDPLAKSVSAALPNVQCLDAGIMTVGIQLTVQMCAALATIQTAAGYPQLFFYEPDLSLRLFYSVSVANPNGLCADGVANAPAVTLQQCAVLGSAPAAQQWRLNALGSFVSSNGTSCMTASATGAVTVATCATGYNAAASWAPTPSAGVGAAGAVAGQLTSLSQAARCAHAMNADGSTAPPTSSMTLVLYPCEQQLAPAQVGWYQNFTYNPTSDQWSSTYPGDGKSYCLTSPSTAGAVQVALCSSTATSQQWAENGVALGDPGDATSPSTQYTVKDQSGRCLSVSPTSTYTSSATLQAYNMIVTATCATVTDKGGVTRADPTQQWNANPGPQSAVITGLSE